MDDQRSVIGKNKCFANLATRLTLYRYNYLKPAKVTISDRFIVVEVRWLREEGAERGGKKLEDNLLNMNEISRTVYRVK